MGKLQKQLPPSYKCLRPPKILDFASVKFQIFDPELFAGMKLCEENKTFQELYND